MVADLRLIGAENRRKQRGKPLRRAVKTIDRFAVAEFQAVIRPRKERNRQALRRLDGMENVREHCVLHTYIRHLRLLPRFGSRGALLYAPFFDKLLKTETLEEGIERFRVVFVP